MAHAAKYTCFAVVINILFILIAFFLDYSLVMLREKIVVDLPWNCVDYFPSFQVYSTAALSAGRMQSCKLCFSSTDGV